MEQRTNNYELDLVGRGQRLKSRVVVSVRDWTEGGLRHRPCTVVVTWAGASADAEADDVYHAFQNVREQLERRGLTPDCYGSCADVQVSGMLVDMGDGTMAYRMGAVPKSERPPTVNIFESEPGLKLGTVAEQQAYLDVADDNVDATAGPARLAPPSPPSPPRTSTPADDPFDVFSSRDRVVAYVESSLVRVREKHPSVGVKPAWGALQAANVVRWVISGDEVSGGIEHYILEARLREREFAIFYGLRLGFPGAPFHPQFEPAVLVDFRFRGFAREEEELPLEVRPPSAKTREILADTLDWMLSHRGEDGQREDLSFPMTYIDF